MMVNIPISANVIEFSKQIKDLAFLRVHSVLSQVNPENVDIYREITKLSLSPHLQNLGFDTFSTVSNLGLLLLIFFGILI